MSAANLRHARRFAQAVIGFRAWGDIALPETLSQLYHLRIANTPELTTLGSVPLDSLNELVVESAPQLADLGGGEPVELSTLSVLRLIDCPSLTTLEPLSSLNAVTDITIENCDGLREVDALATSTVLRLDITENEALTHLPTFSTLTAMSHIRVRGNASLVTGPAFPNLEQLGDGSLDPGTPEFEFTGNPVLQSIGDFPRLRSVSTLALSDNAALVSVDLQSLESLVSLIVQRNASLTQLRLGVQNNLSRVAITDNPNLATLSLGAQSEKLGSLFFSRNPALSPEESQHVLDLVGPETIMSL